VDAILRDSLLGDRPFRQSDEGKALDQVSARNATPLFRLCPTALLFGMWDSTGPKGGLGAKFARAMVSEIIGIDAAFGTKTSSRVDPIIHKNPPLYEDKDGNPTPEEALAAQVHGKAKPYAKKLSELNLGNVTPDMARYAAKAITKENSQTVDPMRPDGDYIKAGRLAPGGVTIASAEQTVVLSLPALRRLCFPAEGQLWKPTPEQTRRDEAARTVLAALGLCAVALAAEKGLDLRSRCLLWPEHELKWELLGKPGSAAVEYELDAAKAVALLKEAVAHAERIGLSWREEPLLLKPSPRLVALLKKSQELAAATGAEDGEEG
jgi:CRISPR-associated protein Csb1